jgi:phage recombination protein Bet
MTNEIKVNASQDLALNFDDLKEYFGQDLNPKELKTFFEQSKAMGLNPFLKEIYVVKYGSSPAQFLVSRDAYRKRASKDANYLYTEVGMIEIDKDGNVTESEGTFRNPTKQLIGAYAKVFMRNIDHPFTAKVNFDEYVQRNKDGKPNAMWQSKPATMIGKVAEAQALRMAFPDLSGTYVADEMPRGKEVKPRDVTGEQTKADIISKLEAERGITEKIEKEDIYK